MKKYTDITASSPIGIFDSGLGGLSICKEIIELLPNESIIYLADSANAPYGEKSKAEIIDLSIKNIELLLKLGCKAIVVACNTATTNAIAVLRTKYDVPFIGIEPATKTAVLQSKTKKIGVLATQGTLQSELFLSTSNQFKADVEIIETQGEHLVRLIEEGKIDETKPLIKKYLAPMVAKGVDCIVLGCTHYPFLIPMIKAIVPSNIKIIDSGKAVAKQAKNVLEQNGLLCLDDDYSQKVFYTNKNEILLADFLEQIKISASEVSYLNF